MRPIKKTIYLLNINNYAPRIRALTYPLIYRYAEKIGADVHEIWKRQFPDFPPVYEKLQIRDLARVRGDDWAIYIDSDALIAPETIDFTVLLKKDTVLHYGTDHSPVRWRYDEHFLRDGRGISSCNWFTIASDWCLDLWTPLDIPLEEAVRNITLDTHEVEFGIRPDHLIDDYTLSRNVARYGLKVDTVLAMWKRLDMRPGRVWHKFTLTESQKFEDMKSVIQTWKLPAEILEQQADGLARVGAQQGHEEPAPQGFESEVLD